MSRVIGCVFCECDIEGMRHDLDCPNHPDNLAAPREEPKEGADKELPTLASLRGIAPDMTNGLSSEEYIRRIREEGAKCEICEPPVTEGHLHVKWSEEDEMYVATTLTFPLLSGLGPSEEEAQAELQVAIDLATQEGDERLDTRPMDAAYHHRKREEATQLERAKEKLQAAVQEGAAQPDGTDRLCRALYGRNATPKDYLGGSQAKMLHDAADRLAHPEAAVPEGPERITPDDEIVGRGWVHLERMSSGHIWMNILGESYGLKAVKRDRIQWTAQTGWNRLEGDKT